MLINATNQTMVAPSSPIRIIWINSGAPPLSVQVVVPPLNYFRLAGDLSHVLSFVVLLLRLRTTKNAIGISIKTQELYLVVFITLVISISLQLCTQCTIQSWKSYISRLLRISYLWLKVPSRSKVPTRKCTIHFCIGNLPCYPASFWL